ncbi:MAG: hypothetical protein ACE5HM_08725, partial [Acidiferrobacterales bacterium]
GAAPFSGDANDGAGGAPIFFNPTLGGPDGAVLRQNGAPSFGVMTDPTGEGFSVSFGNWNGTTSAAVLLPDADGFVQQPVGEFVHWITMTPSIPTGSVAYFASGSAVAATGSGTGGLPLQVTRFQSDVNFSTGSLTNGRMVIFDGNTWDAFFTGTVNAGNFTASLDPATSTVNGTPGAVGGVEGAFTDNVAGISGIGGVFDFEDGGVNNVQGAFVAREDRRFAANELASVNQVGVAAVSAPGPGQPFIGEASAGAGGSPIIFDVTGNEVLRQAAAPLFGTVTTDTTLGATFPVSWGAWNASIGSEASIQGDPNTAAPTQLISDPVYWTTATATPATSLPTGTFTYVTVLGFQGAGEAGTVNAVAMNVVDATLNLGTGMITAGTMSVQNGPRVSGFFDQWNASLVGGTFTAGQLDVTVTGGTVVVDTVTQTGVSGTVNGIMTGPNGEGITGAFNMQQGATNHVGGTFFVRQ